MYQDPEYDSSQCTGEQEQRAQSLHIQPATMLWNVMHFKPAVETKCFLRQKNLIQGNNGVGIQVVHYQDDLGCVWILFIQQPFDLLRPIFTIPIFLCSAKRHPLSGSVHTKMQAVPFRMYSIVSILWSAWFSDTATYIVVVETDLDHEFWLHLALWFDTIFRCGYCFL